MWSFILIFMAVVVALDAAWWWLADRLLRPLPRARLWRLMWSGFMLLQFGAMALLMAGRFTRTVHWRDVPIWVLSMVLIWHLFILPSVVVLFTTWRTSWGVGRLIGWGARRLRSAAAAQPVEIAVLAGTGAGEAAVAEPASDPAEDADDDEPILAARPPLSRRQFLETAFAAVPPVVAATMTGTAVHQLTTFRMRRIDIRSATLPRALDGLTIAHVSDTHVGDFTNGPVLDDIVAATNSLDADLVLVTGDIINHDLTVLDDANRMIRRMRGRYGVVVCEGNHDLFQGREEFEDGVRSAGINLLVNQENSLRIRGEKVQILGLRWGGLQRHRSREHDRGDQAIADSMNVLRPMLRDNHYQILMAHHPHAFDPARELGIPLTLSGHTHGGQLMLSRHLGAGQLIGFRYMSGLYGDENNALVVSNGTGNWFPLRVNAPAEIIHVTMHRA